MRKRVILPMLVLLLLIPWPVAYAYDASDGVIGGVAGQEPILIEASDPSAAPHLNVCGSAIGGVQTPGDLFYIDATENPADISVSLYLTNAEVLIRSYRYMTLEVGVYVQNGTNEWQKISGNSGEPVPQSYITLQNGQASCTLPGYAKYKLTIDSGCFYCSRVADDSSLSPQFYLTAE